MRKSHWAYYPGSTLAGESGRQDVLQEVALTQTERRERLLRAKVQETLRFKEQAVQPTNDAAEIANLKTRVAVLEKQFASFEKTFCPHFEKSKQSPKTKRERHLSENETEALEALNSLESLDASKKGRDNKPGMGSKKAKIKN